MTFNTGDTNLDEEVFIELIRREGIEVLMLQECRGSEMEPILTSLGWSYRQSGGIVIGTSMELSESSILSRSKSMTRGSICAVACDIRLNPDEQVRVVAVHLPTFRPSLSMMQAFQFKAGAKAMKDQGAVYHQINHRIQTGLDASKSPTIVAGDFNVPIESRYYRDHWKSMSNAFSLTGFGFGHTKFTRWHGIRIDHVLADDHWRIVHCRVGPDLGSDHRPVITELSLVPSSRN